MKKHIGLIIIIIVIIFTGIIFLHSIYMNKEHTLDLQLHSSYNIDTNNIRKYVHVNENQPFTYFLQINSGNSILDTSNRNNILTDYGLRLPDELLNDIASSDESWYVLLSIGRELKEVKYKLIKRYNDGITSEAIITFCEEYQGDVVNAYFINKHLYFLGEYYYIMHGDKRVF